MILRGGVIVGFAKRTNGKGKQVKQWDKERVYAAVRARNDSR